MEIDWDALFKSDYMGPIKLYPNENNLLYKKPVILTYQHGYFYSKKGPDFYWRDVAEWNNGFELIQEVSSE